MGMREYISCKKNKEQKNKNPQNPGFFSQLPTSQNISKLHTEAQDVFSTELSSASLTLLHATIKMDRQGTQGLRQLEMQMGLKWETSGDSQRERVAEETAREKTTESPGGEAGVSALNSFQREKHCLHLKTCFLNPAKFKWNSVGDFGSSFILALRKNVCITRILIVRII